MKSLQIGSQICGLILAIRRTFILALLIFLPFIESSFEKCFPLKSVGEFSPSLSCQFREAQVPSESAMQNPLLPPHPSPLPPPPTPHPPTPSITSKNFEGKKEKPTVSYTARESNINILFRFMYYQKLCCLDISKTELYCNVLIAISTFISL
jgi:hypothetical protein